MTTRGLENLPCEERLKELGPFLTGEEMDQGGNLISFLVCKGCYKRTEALSSQGATGKEQDIIDECCLRRDSVLMEERESCSGNNHSLEQFP